MQIHETNTGAKKTLYIIDGNSYIYRAYYAIKNLSTSYGLPTNAIFGFANMLMKVIKEKRPDLIATVFDSKGPTRRHIEYREYKAHRPPMPKDLVPQIPYIHELVQAFRIPVFMQDGQEADDIIASLAHKAVSAGCDVTIVTGDKDILQLVGDSIRVYDTLKEKVYGPKDVEERFGVGPERMVEIMGLMGDSSDNIPGVPGIGEKTAQALIREYGNIENVLARVQEITKPKLKQSLIENAHLARLSRELACLQTDLPVDFDLERISRKDPDNSALLALLRRLEFPSLLKYATPGPEQEKNYLPVLDERDFQKLLDLLSSSREFSFDAETTDLNPLRADLVGLSFSVRPAEGYYLPLSHTCADAPEQIPLEHAVEKLKPLFAREGIGKIGQNLKYDLLVLGRYGIEVRGPAFDTMIGSYLLHPGRTSHGLEALALEFLNYKTTTYTDVTGSGRKQICFDKVAIEKATAYAAEDADIALRLKQTLEPKLREQNLDGLFRDIEMPLMEVLVDMERSGVRIDAEFLKTLSRRLERETAGVMKTIYELAGMEFNINSPKQLADILFVKLKLNPVKKTKTGFSTNVDVLEDLARFHPLPAEILKFRTLAKLKSTYIDALPALINPKTGRVHTSFNQAVTATGRLSSSDPNLQNIPIRTELGREIRQAFIADPGSSLISADYSQIELRVLAHMSGDPGLIRTFIEDQDIHTRTASEILGLLPEEITAEMRRKAKAVNFGIIYGISAFGLAQNTGVSNAEAKKYIESYFARYPKVREFIDKTIEDAKIKGYVTTLFGRRRFIPELSSSAAQIRNFGERTAVNTPIQGTAADLIKIAMIRIKNRLDREGLRSKMILQVHDELVFEVPDAEIEVMKALIRGEMEGVVSLAVPIRTDMGVGKNWDQAH